MIEKARSLFIAKFKPWAWFQKKWGTVHAIECIVPVVGNHVKNLFSEQKKLLEDAGKNVEERLLFNGTSLESVNGIAENNFDISAVPSSHERGKAMYLGRGVYFSEAPTVSLGYGSSLLVCQVLPGKTEHLADREAADHPIAREVWDSRQVRAGKVWVIPAASQILPFCVIHCYFQPPGFKILSGATSRAAGLLASQAFGDLARTALKEWRSWDRPRARDPDSSSSKLIRKELDKISRDPRPGTFVGHEKDNIFFKIHILVTGPYDTVLEGGLLHFQLYCPPDYPFTAPSLQLLTGMGSPSLHRVLGSRGRVLLPLLYHGWSHSRGLSDILSSLQAALASQPFTGQGWEPSAHRAV